MNTSKQNCLESKQNCTGSNKYIITNHSLNIMLKSMDIRGFMSIPWIPIAKYHKIDISTFYYTFKLSP